MIRVALIGCGKIADEHATQIQRIPNCNLVSVCDRELLMAEQMAERFRVPQAFADSREMLVASRPTVVHITTPPHSHFSLAKECLESGCAVYVEKPFTVNYEEALELVRIAETVGQKLTVGHNTQFTPAANEMRQLIRSGYLGGPPIHMESSYCYNFSDQRYAKALLGDADHWVRALPGGLLQNVISHGLGKIIEYLPGDQVRSVSHGFVSRFLSSIGEAEILDELRVIIYDECSTTAYFTFSSQLNPPLHQFAVYGPKNSLILDHHHQTLLRVPGKAWKSYLNQFVPPLGRSWQYCRNGWQNVFRFFGRDFHADYGLHWLIRAFYQAVRGQTPLPIPYRDILRTARLMDDIFAELEPKRSPQHPTWQAS